MLRGTVGAMELFVIRHATAVARNTHDPDVERALTPKGRKRFEKAVRGLDRLGARFDLLLHGPWRRAVQTAQIARPLVEGETRETDLLARRPSRALLAQLAGERVAVVGHEPWLSELVALLAFDETQLGARFELGKGSVVWLDGEPRPGAMKLRALLPCRVLRALA